MMHRNGQHIPTHSSSKPSSSATRPPASNPKPGLTSDEDAFLTIRLEWKGRLHQLLEHPASSSSAYGEHGAHRVQRAQTVLGTVATFHRVSNRVWLGMETGLVVVSTVKVYREGGVLEFPVYGIIDLLSVYLCTNILRMFRLLRVILYVEYLSVRRSQHALLAIGFCVVMMLKVFSTLYTSPNAGPQLRRRPTQFASIPPQLGSVSTFYCSFVPSPSPLPPFQLDAPITLAVENSFSTDLVPNRRSASTSTWHARRWRRRFVLLRTDGRHTHLLAPIASVDIPTHRPPYPPTRAEHRHLAQQPAPLDPPPSVPNMPTSAPAPPTTLSPTPWHCDLPSQQHHSSDVLPFTSLTQSADNV
ncbi:hypothetical protein DFP72DRAFT_1080786 [Ephemerocybe angulata]|uniref:Ion transport domain-containing protein n=1 Tax=Ephemerocybe angulata TaxID=980116 RepID=A0A8H6HC37_9AGAR|nr:hypothetical protein DFP72DRAFT_1080786 [Tulosesus angulatus]